MFNKETALMIAKKEAKKAKIAIIYTRSPTKNYT